MQTDVGRLILNLELRLEAQEGKHVMSCRVVDQNLTSRVDDGTTGNEEGTWKWDPERKVGKEPGKADEWLKVPLEVLASSIPSLKLRPCIHASTLSR